MTIERIGEGNDSLQDGDLERDGSRQLLTTINGHARMHKRLLLYQTECAMKDIGQKLANIKKFSAHPEHADSL